MSQLQPPVTAEGCFHPLNTPWKLQYVTPALGARYRAGRKSPGVFLWLCGAAAQAGFWQPRAAAHLAAATPGTVLPEQLVPPASQNPYLWGKVGGGGKQTNPDIVLRCKFFFL